MGGQRENVRPSHQSSAITVAWQRMTSVYTRLIGESSAVELTPAV